MKSAPQTPPEPGAREAESQEESRGPRRATSVLCIPTRLERDRLQRLDPRAAAPGDWLAVELVGFGPVAAAATGASLAARYPGADLVLAGIAGSYQGGGPGRLEVGEAAFFGTVGLDGVGAGDLEDHVLPSTMGFPQLEDASGAVFETLPLSQPPLHGAEGRHGPEARSTGEAPTLLTVCAASGTPRAASTRQRRFPGAVAEDMEAFGLALAARLFDRRLFVIRGISNHAGDRDTSQWRIDDALKAAGAMLRDLP